MVLDSRAASVLVGAGGWCASLAPQKASPSRHACCSAVALVLCLALLPTQPLRLDPHPMLVASVLWLGGVISVGATVLLYRMLRAGNLVNVTSLFYLVPGGTALLDWWLLGNRMAPLALLGLALVVAGLVLVFRARPAR